MRTALVLLILCTGVARAEEADALSQQASVAHKHAQQTKDPKDYEKAAELYRAVSSRSRRIPMSTR